jgi:two-component system, chemotaxis family, response regulator Rcp1
MQDWQIKEKTVDLLLIEDSHADARLTIEALRDARILNTVHVLTDGVEALRYLRREGEHAAAVTPDFIILDLNLPKKTGLEVLHEIKEDDSLRSIPVIILSSSKAQEDVAKAYTYQASCYITKPIDADQYFTAIRSLKELWFKVVTFPTRAAAL